MGVNEGGDEIRRDSNGNPYGGGRPTNNDVETTREGKVIRENLKEYILSQNCTRPSTNWYRENNRILDG